VNYKDILFFHNWFKNYVKQFGNNENIKLKKEHTYRVCKNIIQIGKDLKLDKEKLYLAQTIALFHDLGRFEQFYKYGTFRDAKSVNHALLSVKILQLNKILKGISKREKKLICKAIAYHNKRILPKNEDSECLFYSKLIRDADKLDIFYVFIKYYENAHYNPVIELELPERNDYSKKIVEDILNSRISDLSLMQTTNDMKLMLLSWLFDINFIPTYRYIKQRRYIEKLINFLPKTDDIKKIKIYLEKYLERKIQSSNLL